MNNRTNTSGMHGTTRRSRSGYLIAIGAASILGIGALVYTALADPPELTIEALGSNQYSITITNGIATTNYTLLWTPALADVNYPWQVLSIGNTGETNFVVNGGEWPVGFFQIMLGSDADEDGVPTWQDANDNDPSIGILSVTIDSPQNGTTLQ